MLRNRTMSQEIVQLNEQAIRTELKELVRQSVEEVLNGFLDADAYSGENGHRFRLMAAS